MKTSKLKMTELGPIPAEWSVVSLGDLFSFKNGYNTSAECYGAGTPVASVLEALDWMPVTNSRIRTKVIAPEGARCAFSLKKGDLIFTRSSETLEDVGRSNVYVDDEPAMFGGFVIRGRPKTRNDSRFINFLLKDQKHHERVMSKGAGAQHYNIGQTGLAKVLITLPTLPEQERIAEALSDVDALLSAMTTLIEKKRAIKQGAMQELLGMRNAECGMRNGERGMRNAKCGMRNVPRRRLAGFSGEWVEKRLGDCGTAIRGVSYKPYQAFYESGAGRTMLLRSNNIQDNVLTFDDVVYVSEECIGDEQYMRCDDILICAANGSRNLVGKSAVLKTMGQTVTFGAFMAIFRANSDIDAGFAGYLLQTESYRKQLDDILTGSAINNLNSKDILGLAFAVPPTLAEQQAIAAVLSDMDAEIAALEAKRAKYESIKLGMMQELLTGKTRLKGE